MSLHELEGLILGILSRLLSKNTERNSYVRRWLVHETGKLDNENTDVFTLFVKLIYAASSFGKESAAEQENAQKVAKQYFGDTTIFEIACYTYECLNSWLSKNEPDFRVVVADPIASWIIEIFSVAWRKDEGPVSLLLAERLDTYRAMARYEDGGEAVHRELEQRILNTRGDQLGNSNVANDHQSMPGDYQFINHSREFYETTQIPMLIDAVREYCKNQYKQDSKSDGKVSLSQDAQADQEKRDYRFAMALLEQRDYVKACRAFTKVIEINPENYNAFLERGRLYFILRQPLDAIDDFSKAIDLKPGDSRAHLERAKCYHLALRAGDKSLADYSQAISLAPNEATGYFLRGLLFDEVASSAERQALEIDDKEKYAAVSEEFLAAINDYSQAIALNPNYDEVYVKRGLAYARKARANRNADYMQKSIDDLEKAMSLNWENGYLYKTVDELKELGEHLQDTHQPTLV
jgi:tetratricopeptide (TPR) repeat protein